jgi:hypothetical protein
MTTRLCACLTDIEMKLPRAPRSLVQVRQRRLRTQSVRAPLQRASAALCNTVGTGVGAVPKASALPRFVASHRRRVRDIVSTRYDCSTAADSQSRGVLHGRPVQLRASENDIYHALTRPPAACPSGSTRRLCVSEVTRQALPPPSKSERRWARLGSRRVRTRIRVLCSCAQRQPSSGATSVRMVSMTCVLYSTPSWFGTVSRSVSAAAIASSWAS